MSIFSSLPADLFLAAVVAATMALLGLLISTGNERQRQAIDGLREQAERWAEQDIRIKREKLARQITVSEPLAWLEKTAAESLGSAPKLVTVTPWQKGPLTAILGHCQDGRTLVFTPASRPHLLKALGTKGQGSALNRMENALLGPKPQQVAWFELSVVTQGMFFDLEAAQVWQALTGETMPAPRLTMYEVPAPGKGKRG